MSCRCVDDHYGQLFPASWILHLAVMLCQHSSSSERTCKSLKQACMVFVVQDVQAALQRAREAANAAAAAEAQRYALLQAAKLQESAQLHQQLEQVCIALTCKDLLHDAL